MLLFLATLVAVVILVVTEVAQKQNFERLSSTDAMTGLYNKKTFTAQVEDYLTYEKNLGVLIFLDVVNFKIYNDKYGHLNGDAVLKKFARELLEELGMYGNTTTFVMFFHFAEKAFTPEMFPYRKN